MKSEILKRKCIMMTVKKGLIGCLILLALFLGSCYGTQTGSQRAGSSGPARAYELAPLSSGHPGPGVGGIGITPGGSYYY